MELHSEALYSYNQKITMSIQKVLSAENIKEFFFSHLNTLSIVLFCPHIFEDGIHGPPVIKLLFKLMRVT